MNESPAETYAYDDIMKEVEDAVMGRTSGTVSHRLNSNNNSRVTSQVPEYDPGLEITGESYTSATSIEPDSSQTHTNGAGMTSGIDINYDAYSDDSEAEAAAGLAAMQMAEEEEASAAARRVSRNIDVRSAPLSSNPPPEGGPSYSAGSSDNDIPIDMDTFGGGISSQLHYQYGAENACQTDGTTYSDRPIQHSTSNSTRPSEISGENLAMPPADYFMAGDDAIHPFPSFGARTDTGGTGGLAEPTSHTRRLSFEDGDESTLLDFDNVHDSGASSPSKDSGHSRQPSRAPSRPLPLLPHLATTDHQRQKMQFVQSARSSYPLGPQEYEQNYTPAGTPLKANSISSFTSTPQIIPPGRSITDAEARRRHERTGSQARGLDSNGLMSAESMGTPGATKFGEIVLPSIPAGKRNKFIPVKLSSADFARCAEPWALSSILAWIKEMTDGEAYITPHAITDGFVALFTHKVPTMNTADAETLAARVVDSMFQAEAIVRDEEWVRFGSGDMFGVLFQLTGTGCYSPRVHCEMIPGRCYSYHCMRTLKKIDLYSQTQAPQRKEEPWVTFYNLKKEDVEGRSKKEVERQNNLHEIVTSEDVYIDQLNVLRLLYRDGLAKSQQSIISPKKIESFLQDVFGKIDALKEVNENFLLAQLKYRQQEQGPWIAGFSDIFREWVRKAKVVYTEYAASFPNATMLVRREAERNVLFRQFLDQMREDERSKRLGWDTFLKAPITRLQRYGLLLGTVYKNSMVDNEEKSNLAVAMTEVKTVTLECDAQVAHMTTRVTMLDLSTKLKLRPGMEKVQLNLNHLGREIIFQGDLQRKGNNKVSWLDTRAILFDHYMVLAKPIQTRDAAGALRNEVLDVSKLVCNKEELRCPNTDTRVANSHGSSRLGEHER